MMRCPSAIDLQSYFDHELTPAQTQRIRKHLAQCEACRERLAEYGWAVDALQKTLGRVIGRPEEVSRTPHPGFGWNRMAVAATFIVVIGFSGWCFSIWKAQSAMAPQDEELTEQYLLLHMDEVNGGTNG